MLRILLILFLLKGISLVSLGQIKNKGIPFINNYSPSIYKAHAQNHGAVQDRRGVMYFANKSGVLEYDGSRWHLIKISGDLEAHALAVDPKGKIYVGSNGELGYLSADAQGQVTFQSLLAKIPPTQRDFEEISNILVSEGVIIFQAKRHLFLWRDGEMQVLTSNSTYDQIFQVHGQVYAREWENGLLVLEQGKFRKIPGGDIYAYDPVRAAIPYPQGKILWLSQNQPPRFYHPLVKTAQKLYEADFPANTQNFLLKQGITCGIRLDEHHLAFGTRQAGLLITDNQGHAIQHLDQPQGLQNSSVLGIYQDQALNLWLSLDMGITHVEINSPFTIYNEHSGLEGRVINSVLHQGKLYVGTSRGIFYRDWQPKHDPLEEPEQFKLVANTEGYAGSCLSFQHSLLYSHSEGVLVIEDSIARTLVAHQAALSFSKLKKHPNYLLLGKIDGGLSLLEKKGDTWLFKRDIASVREYCHALHEDQAGYIWFSDYAKGIFRIKLDENLEKVEQVKHLTDQDGLPSYSRNNILSLAGALIFITREGIYRYHPSRDRFEPDQKLNAKLFAKTYAQPIVADGNGNLWFIQYGSVGCISQPSGRSPEMDTTRFYKLRIDVMSHITPIDQSNILFGTRGGLFHYAPQVQDHFRHPYRTLMRSISVQNRQGGDSLLFAGTFLNQYQAAASWPSQSASPVLAYDYNNIRFRFAATWYEEIEKTVYQYRLAGLDGEWSPWSNSLEKDYTNLHEGKYTFLVRAKNIYGQVSEVARFSFEILPPWYRTYGAYLAYGLLAFGLVVLMVRVNTLRLRRKNLYLAREINKGLAEIRQKNEELETKNARIEQSYQDMKLLGEMGRDITKHLSTDNIINTVYQNINMLMDASVFGMGFYNEKLQQLDFVEVREQGQRLNPFSLSLEERQRLAVWCFHTRREVLLNNYQEEFPKYIDEKLPPITGEEAVSIIYVPLIIQQQVIGVVTVQSFQAHAYSSYHLNILKNLVVPISIALENAKAYQRLEELNMEKNHLIGIVAHDLRNPLHHIYGLANVIQLNAENLDPKQKAYLAKILDSTARINDMIAKILDMNAIESNRMNLQWEPVNLCHLMREACESMANQAVRKQIRIVFAEQNPDCIVKIDRNYGLQVFENLISNALKFSRPQAQVALGVERQNGAVIAKVIDQGPGISAQDQARLFGKFQRLSAQPTAGEPATGLGLSIVKKYVEAMQGEVWCESELGQGATFIVKFQAAK